LTVIPAAATSWAAVFAQAHRPVRAILERARSRSGCRTVAEGIKQIRPHCCCLICGRAARARRMDANMFAFTAARICSSSTSNVPPMGGPPALPTTISIRPQRLIAASMSCAGSPASLMSPGTTTASGRGGGKSIQGRLVPGVDNHPSTLRCECPDTSPSETLRRRSNDRNAVTQAEIHSWNLQLARPQPCGRGRALRGVGRRTAIRVRGLIVQLGVAPPVWTMPSLVIVD
jgi:hypothetical protein